MTDRSYYLVPDQHPVRDHIEAYIQSHKDFESACRKFSRKHGGDGNFWQVGNSFKGLQFDGPNPAGWGHRQGDDKRCMTPYGKSKEAYALREEIKQLPRAMDNWGFETLFGGPMRGIKDGMGVLSFTSFERVGQDYIVGVPTRSEMPDVLNGCTELKMSQYYDLKEKPKAAGE